MSYCTLSLHKRNKCNVNLQQRCLLHAYRSLFAEILTSAGMPEEKGNLFMANSFHNINFHYIYYNRISEHHSHIPVE